MSPCRFCGSQRCGGECVRSYYSTSPYQPWLPARSDEVERQVSLYGSAWLDDREQLVPRDRTPRLVRKEVQTNGVRTAYLAIDVYGTKWVSDDGLVYRPFRQNRGFPQYAPMMPIPKPDLPVRQQEDTYVGFKTSRLVADGGRLRIKGMTGKVYDIDATAACGAGGTHKAPERQCSCGFHALIDAPSNWEYGGFRTTVELFGTVIRGERGWRAERQRVLKVEARQECEVSGHKEKAVGFTLDKSGVIIAVCEDHAVLSYATPAELTGKLGTKVRWAS